MAPVIEDWQAGGFGLYVHWPFCASKCPYCDFNSHVVARVDTDRWERAYLSEIRRSAALTPGRVLNSIFFGGGTPSLMEPALVARIIEAAAAAWAPANDIEITLEANPSSVEAARFAGYRSAGVNRVSLGVQALDDPSLRHLGRLHSAAEAVAAIGVARAAFDRVSFDLIYARQHQALADWRNELTEALSLAADHLSLYQLTIEDGTAFAARHAAGGLRGLPDEDRAADMYELTQELCEAAGYPAYEISNHAVPGAECRHNLVYWRSGDWVGIGPGAHGRLTLSGRRRATETERMPQDWLERVERAGTGEVASEPLDAASRAAEYVMMGLRLSGGISVNRLSGLKADVPWEKMKFLSYQGRVKVDGNEILTTPKGRLVLNSIVRELLSG